MARRFNQGLPMAEKHLTPLELAQRLGVSLRSIERWRTTGEGPAFVRAGARAVRYPLAAIEAWEAGRLHTSRAAEMVGRAA
jgi:predicted DNA-binding transcriptional regulator AlpA